MALQSFVKDRIVEQKRTLIVEDQPLFSQMGGGRQRPGPGVDSERGPRPEDFIVGAGAGNSGRPQAAVL